MHGGRLVSGTVSRVPCRVGIPAVGDAYAVEIRHVLLHVNNWILLKDGQRTGSVLRTVFPELGDTTFCCSSRRTDVCAISRCYMTC